MIDLDYREKDTLTKCMDLPRRDLLRDIMSYNGAMTISQVVKFFERQGVSFTKSMIQHYIRVGVLPPPEDKRRYSRFHLLLLAVIERLKGIYSLEEISAVFSCFEPAEELIDPFQDLMEFAVAAWRETLSALVDKAARTADELGLDKREGRRAFEACVLLGIMAQSAEAKRVAGMLTGGARGEI